MEASTRKIAVHVPSEFTGNSSPLLSKLDEQSKHLGTHPEQPYGDIY